MTIWHIRRVGEDTIICYLSLNDIKNIRPLVKETKVKVYFIERKGMPFLIIRRE
ncbi:sporulation protein YqfD [Anaerobacillus sp. HL2]|nr:sporulation protein YqfD [Anaerobacillus sp. HL2]